MEKRYNHIQEAKGKGIVNGLVRRWITRWQCLAYNTRLDRCVDCGSEIFSSTRVQQSEKYIYNRWKISLVYIFLQC